jgi:hypothetical protein
MFDEDIRGIDKDKIENRLESLVSTIHMRMLIVSCIALFQYASRLTFHQHWSWHAPQAWSNHSWNSISSHIHAFLTWYALYFQSSITFCATSTRTISSTIVLCCTKDLTTWPITIQVRYSSISLIANMFLTLLKNTCAKTIVNYIDCLHWFTTIGYWTDKKTCRLFCIDCSLLEFKLSLIQRQVYSRIHHSSQ